MRLEEWIDDMAGWAHAHRIGLGRGGAAFAGLVLGMLILWSGGLDRLWNEPESPKPPRQPPPAAVVPAPPSVKELQADVSQGRLGTDSSISPVSLRLRLVQTFPGSDEHSGRALLGVERDHPQTYLAGAILENGARLDEIHADYVMLVRGAHRTRLDLDRPGADTPARLDALESVGRAVPAGEQTVRLSAEPVTDYLRPVPVYRNDVVVGFQVYPGRQKAPFAQWGLHPGDLVIAVDGQPLSDPDLLMQMLRGLVDGQVLTATVVRNGAEVAVRLDGTAIPPLSANVAAPAAPPD